MKILIANWKQHPDTLEQVRKLFAAETTVAAKYPSVQTVICPPSKFIGSLVASGQSLVAKLGSQDVFWNAGENNYGVKYALVGHSDRRIAGDTDGIINQKLKIALGSDVTPILLVGEKIKGDDRQAILEKQLTLALANLTTAQVVRIMICYEPVWAISTNPSAEPDKPENTLEAAKIIQNITGKKEILYGGSVSGNNIAYFLSHPQLAGAVIGRASLNPEQLGDMLKIVSEL